MNVNTWLQVHGTTWGKYRTVRIWGLAEESMSLGAGFEIFIAFSYILVYSLDFLSVLVCIGSYI